MNGAESHIDTLAPIWCTYRSLTMPVTCLLAGSKLELYGQDPKDGQGNGEMEQYNDPMYRKTLLYADD